MALAVPAVAMAACGSSAHHSVTNVTPSTSSAASGAKTFTAPGMAVRFKYPSGFHVVHLGQSKRIAGTTGQASHAAVGIGKYDLLVVTRFPNRPIPVTAKNIRQLKPVFDQATSSVLGHRVSSVVQTIGGLPALSFPPTPVVGLPVAATSRITNVFVDDDEYELNCQYTAAAAAKVISACDQMLSTLQASG
jgi:hypothetical protein